MKASNNWNPTTITDLCEVTSSKRTYAKDIVDAGIPFYRSKEIIEIFKGQREFSDPLFITEERYQGIKDKFGVPQVGDVMITSRGTLGIPLVIKDSRPFYFADGNLSWFKNLNGIESHFLYYWLLSPAGKAQLQKCTIGSSQQAYTIVQLKKMEVLLPPLPTQRKIASILSAYDDLIENNTRRIAILEEMAQAMYREWFVHFRFPGHENVKLVDSPLGPIPDGWEATTVGELCTTVRAGGTPKRKQDNYWAGGTIDWYKTKELWDGFLFESEEKITELASKESTTRMFDPDTILMAIYGSPTVGRMGILTRRSACNQAALAMVPDPSKVSIPFLFHVLLSLRDHFNTIAMGAAQQNISKAKVVNASCVLPPHSIVEQFDDVCGPVFNLVKNISLKNRNLRATRDLLLPKLISGKLDVEELDIDVGLTTEALEEATA